MQESALSATYACMYLKIQKSSGSSGITQTPVPLVPAKIFGKSECHISLITSRLNPWQQGERLDNSSRYISILPTNSRMSLWKHSISKGWTRNRITGTLTNGNMEQAHTEVMVWDLSDLLHG